MRQPRCQRALRFLSQLITLVSVGFGYWLWIYPQVRRELADWQERAEAIPDPVLREQALYKLTGERLNPEAAAFFAVLTPRRSRRKVVRLIVAYQVLYDYLDGLNELPGFANLRNGLQLHRALTDALLPKRSSGDYYRYSPARQDGGYLQRLAYTCRSIMRGLPSAHALERVLWQATERCAQAQSHNHAVFTFGLSSLADWARQQAPGERYLWWELAAAGISCLVIHALVTLAADRRSTLADARKLDRAYFPPICAISALLDSLADYHQDAGTANHSFVAHYRDGEHAADRLAAIARDGSERVRELRHRNRHTIILAGITSYYLSSPSVRDGFPALAAHGLADHCGPIAAAMRSVMRIRRKRHARRYSTE